tara:strand:+ start:113395 stop:113886 length:492 start_codon:yes stop_codon:yes gene_type:complete
MLEKYINQLEEIKNQEDVLSLLKELYVQLKEDTSIEDLFSEDELASENSHVKKLLLDQPTKLGNLKFEVMFFTGKKYTPTHTHPEFVIDEVVEGKLEERIYRCLGDGKYEFVKSEIRDVNDMRMINCEQGYPHEVIGKGDKNFTLCLTLGHDKVEPICESMIK